MSPALKRPIKIHGKALLPWRGKSPPNYIESKAPKAQPALNATPSCSTWCPRAPISTWHLTNGTCDFLFSRAALRSATIYKAPRECEVTQTGGLLLFCSMLHMEWLILPKRILTGQDPTADIRTWNCLTLLHLAHPLDPSKTEYNKSQCLA